MILKNLFTSLFFIVLGFTSVHCQESKKVLFLGNSYTSVNNLPSIVDKMAQNSNDELIYDSYTPGGYRLMNHASNSTSLNKIKAEDWDYVVLQAQSQEASFPVSQMQVELFPYAEALSDSIRANNDCSQPLFYMTWGRKNGDASNCPSAPWLCEYKTMDSAIRVTYIFMADENNALLAPAGAVWRNIRTNHPEIDLYSSDESHPSLAGSYAAACALYTMVYKKNPALITWDSTLPATDAEIIRLAAKEVVFDSINYWDYTLNPAFADFNETITEGEVSYTNTSNNYDSLVWDFGDSTTSTADNPVHTYSEIGTYTVTLTVTKCGQTDVKTKTIHIDVLDTKVLEKTAISIYPNPVYSALILDFGKSIKDMKCSIMDVSGRTLLEKNNINSTKMTLDFSGFGQGIYFLRLTADGQVLTQRIIKE